MRFTLPFAISLLFVAACSSDVTDPGPGSNGTTPDEMSNNAATSANAAVNNADVDAVTYHADVRPILEKQCTSCHLEGGIGPFPLTTYEEVEPLAGLIAMTVETGQMPPWPPAEDCGDFKSEKILTPDEVFAIKEWAEESAPEGDPDDYVAPEEEEQVSLAGEPDFVVDIGTDYVPTPPDGGVDDYHCFVIDPQFTEDKFLNAYQTRPGNVATVHHMLYWAIPKSQENLDKIQELDDLSPDVPGYTCFGSNRIDETGLLGAWVPGTGAIKMEPGHGFRVPADSLIVVQIHYNTVNGTEADRTNIDLYFNDDGETSQVLGMYPFPDTDLNISAGDSNAKEGTSFTLPINVEVYGVFPHMHQLGTRIRVSSSLAGEETCMVDIPDWDFNWQGIYLFEESREVKAGSTLAIDCWYDNSAENQPGGQTPRDVEWGEGTYDEMCLNYFITEELPFL